ncbi:MAG: PAS domain S-box protein [Methylocella sp.]
MSQAPLREEASGATPENLIPANESDRLAAVRRYDILDTPPDGACDRITAIAARLFNVPIAIISVVDHDRIWFKSRHGVSATEIGRDPGLCASVIFRNEPLILPDAKLDPHALANPLVAGEFGLRFYAGVPLRTTDGFNLGTLCVIDKEPREVSTEEIAQLKDLASVVMDQLELRLAARKNEEATHQRAEAAQRFLFMAETMPQKMFTATATGDVDYFNPQWTKFTGLPFEQIRDWGWTRFIHPDDVDENIRVWRHSIETGEPFEFVHRFRRADGAYRWHLSRAQAMRNAAGKISMWIGSNTEIHEQKELAEALRESEARLRESEAQFRTLADNMSPFAWMADDKGSIFWYNQRWYDYTGTTLEQMRGWGWKQVHHPDHVDRVVRRIQHSWDTGEVWEDTYPLRGKDGRYRWFLSRAEPIRDADGVILRWFGTNTDITEKRAAEEALRESDAYLRLVLDSAADGFYGVDRDGVTTTCNAAFLRMLGFERAEDAVGKKLHDVIHHSYADGSHYPKEECHIYQAARTGQAAHVDNELFFRLDGSSFPVEYWSYPILRDDEVQGAVTTFIDITERRRAQEQQRLLLREMNHRVKNLFALAGSVVTLSARSATTAKELAEAVRERLAALARAHELTLPDLTGGGEKSGQATSLATLVRTIVSPYVTQEHARVTTKGPDVPIGRNAVTGIALLLHEMATNAAKYGALSTESGHIDVSWSVWKDELLLAWREHGGPPLNEEPEKEGFGSLLARLTVTGQLAGKISRDWNRDGLTVNLSAPLERLGI